MAQIIFVRLSVIDSEICKPLFFIFDFYQQWLVGPLALFMYT